MSLGPVIRWVRGGCQSGRTGGSNPSDINPLPSARTLRRREQFYISHDSGFEKASNKVAEIASAVIQGHRKSRFDKPRTIYESFIVSMHHFSNSSTMSCYVIVISSDLKLCRECDNIVDDSALF